MSELNRPKRKCNCHNYQHNLSCYFFPIKFYFALLRMRRFEKNACSILGLELYLGYGRGSFYQYSQGGGADIIQRWYIKGTRFCMEQNPEIATLNFVTNSLITIIINHDSIK